MNLQEIMDPQIVAFIGVAAILTVTPGADTMLVIRNVLARGRGAGIITTIGICFGLFIHAVVSALGLSVILVKSATAFEMVKLLGACYLVFLGLQSIRGAVLKNGRKNSPFAVEPESGELPRKSVSRSLLEGFLNNVLNPKVAIFYLAFLPQFIRPTDPVLLKSILLTLIHFAMGLVWLCFVSVFLGRVRTLITRPMVRKRLEAATGVMLVVLGVRLAMERR